MKPQQILFAFLILAAVVVILESLNNDAATPQSLHPESLHPQSLPPESLRPGALPADVYERIYSVDRHAMCKYVRDQFGCGRSGEELYVWYSAADSVYDRARQCMFACLLAFQLRVRRVVVCGARDLHDVRQLFEICRCLATLTWMHSESAHSMEVTCTQSPPPERRPGAMLYDAIARRVVDDAYIGPADAA